MSSIRWRNCVKVTLLSIGFVGFWILLNTLLPNDIHSIYRMVISGISGVLLFIIMLSIFKVEGLDVQHFIRQIQRKVMRSGTRTRKEVM
ncbi:hypothetical protein D3C81_1265280 [compost metagenome]